MSNNNQDWRTIRFLSDEPLKVLNDDDAPRCKPLAEQLAKELVDFINRSKENRASAPRIGVFGGLGQGKTSVINSALDITETQLRENQWAKEKFVEWFDTAHYKNDDLEYELDRLLGGMGPSTTSIHIARLSAYFFPVVTLVSIFLILFALTKGGINWDNLKVILPLLGIGGFFTSVIATVIKPWGYWWRSGQRSNTLGLPIWWRQGLKLLRRNTQILIIDNLDRASLSQQRAVLRALYKHRDDIGYAVIIGFDESRLLEAKPDPEAPIDLLRKAVHVEARMPVRVLTDTLRLAWMAMAAAAELNPQWAKLLNDDKALGALARVLELLSPLQAVSPRLAKHRVNNALFFLAQVKDSNLAEVDDWRAVLRLQALLAVLPDLRNQGDALRLALERNQWDGLDAVIKQLPTIDEATHTLALLVFNETRAYYPADYEWSVWVAAWLQRSVGDFNPNPTPLNATSTLPDFDYVNRLLDGLKRLAQGWPLGEAANVSVWFTGLPLNINYDGAVKQAISTYLPLIDLLLLRLSEIERQRLLNALWAAAEGQYLNWLLSAVGTARFYSRLAEWQLAECNVQPIVDQTAFTQWWTRLVADDVGLSVYTRLRLLSLIPAKRFHLAEILAYVALPDDRDRIDISPEAWVATYGWSGSDKLKMFKSKSSAKKLTLPDAPVQKYRQLGLTSDKFKRVWPPITVTAENFPALLTEHCATWRRLGLQGGLQASPLEFLLFDDGAFGRWLKTTDTDTVLLALSELFSGDDAKWVVEAWLSLLQFRLVLSAPPTASDLPIAQARTASRKTNLAKILRLKKRFEPLWKQASKNPKLRSVQCLLAVTFPSKQALRRLVGDNDEPAIALFVILLKPWVRMCAELALTPDAKGDFHGCKTQDDYAQLLTVAWFSSLKMPPSVWQRDTIENEHVIQ